MKRENYDADHESFRDSVRSFLDREVKPSWDQYIEAKQFPREMWLAFGRQGLLGLEIPEQYGGSAAGDFRYNAVLCEELGRVSMSLSSCHGIHADFAASRPRRLLNNAAPAWLVGSGLGVLGSCRVVRGFSVSCWMWSPLLVICLSRAACSCSWLGTGSGCFRRRCSRICFPRAVAARRCRRTWSRR